ncbi:DNA cytosine methyltransferase [Mucilaginibacter sp. OK098]|uniref:DNA cytosine methyltransferase n=1 Tax=Mucilaginibacter sp. OK098 TaxID=1855297 RepID=UPI0009240D43|nr:DNA cytosine methyltransferase [Mucilaginibacter sp. OK098]SHL96061.1 DNA (cytosine-5)-methyltransferase 1 [Mucilaginibacter sp. OK098]
MPVPIIDLFAGPGGLAEGFSTLVDTQGNRVFKIKLSVEKDAFAHQTLTLRSFLRQFPVNALPAEYYDFLRQTITQAELFDQYPEAYQGAIKEAWQATLGATSSEEIDSRISEELEHENNWVLIGGPPCQAYSLVGRSRVGGVHEDDHRVHLYKEYLRIIAAHQPAVFVMENVKGLLSAELNGEKIFPRILADLSDPSSVFPEHVSSKYRIHSLVTDQIKTDSDFLIRSENYGVPQKRHRVILLGVREDVKAEPGILKKSQKVNLGSVIGMLPKVRSGIYRDYSHTEEIVTGGILKKKRHYLPVKDSYENWSGRVSKYASELSSHFPEGNAEPSGFPVGTGVEYLSYVTDTLSTDHPLYSWFNDKKTEGVVQHASRAHLSLDLKRYMFAALYSKVHGKFPRMQDYREFGDDLVPDHENVESGKFNDRFRVQLPDEPATTVTSHISKDGHYFIHYDPQQCRSLTVREAARIQTFPDNYFFCGPRTQQFHQVGNAVPPYLAFQIGQIVRDVLNKHEELTNAD